MATANLSDYDPASVPDAGEMRFGIVVSDWNRKITWALLDGAIETLKRHGTKDSNIFVAHVPGSFELISGARMLAENMDVDGVICLGCVIQGETPHFTYVSQGVTQGIASLNLSYNIPFIFGVLTTATFQQAEERSGGFYGNKGDEAAITAIKMADLRKKIKK